MKLTNFQKEIIDKIISKEVYDIYSFIEVFIGIKPIQYNWSGTMGFVNFNIRKDKEYQIATGKALSFEETKVNEISDKITSYVIVFDFLLKEKLIASMDIMTREYIPAFVDNDITNKTHNFDPPLNRVNKLIIDCFLFELLISPALEDYKYRNYLTLSEFDILEQNKDRKKSLRWTIVTAFTAIILSVSSILLQIIFSGKERDVKIVNDNAFPESSRVIILNRDSIKDSVEKDKSTNKVNEE